MVDMIRGKKPFIVACIPAFKEEKTISGVVVRAMRYVDGVVVCDDGSGGLIGEMINKVTVRLRGCGEL